jgi:hypothetical protein
VFANALNMVGPSIGTESNGLLCMISSLGPGGAERQAVLTVTQLKQCNLFPISLLTFPVRTNTDVFFCRK